MTVEPVIVRHGDVSVVQLAGEIDLATAGQVGQAVTARTGDGPAMVVDLTDVTFLDSAGIRMLDQVVGACDEAQVRLQIVAAPDTGVRFTLFICAFREELLSDSVREALSRLADKASPDAAPPGPAAI